VGKHKVKEVEVENVEFLFSSLIFLNQVASEFDVFIGGEERKNERRQKKRHSVDCVEERREATTPSFISMTQINAPARFHILSIRYLKGNTS
jgi:hypothetical protein